MALPQAKQDKLAAYHAGLTLPKSGWSATARADAFIACEGNDLRIVLDLRTTKVLTQFHVGKGPDVLGYDAPQHRLYVASESGVVSVFNVSAAGVTLAGEGFVGANAHTLAVDLSAHEVYFPLRERGQPPILRIMQPVLSKGSK